MWILQMSFITLNTPKCGSCCIPVLLGFTINVTTCLRYDPFSPKIGFYCGLRVRKLKLTSRYWDTLGKKMGCSWTLQLHFRITLVVRDTHSNSLGRAIQMNARPGSSVGCISDLSHSWQNQQNGMCAQQRPWSDWEDAQADLSLR